MYKNELTESDLSSLKEIKIGSQPVVSLTYTYNEEQSGRTKVFEIGTIKDGNEYLIQYFVTPSTFSKELPLFMKLANSIKFN